MRPVPAVLAAGGLVIVVLSLWTLRSTAPTSPADPPAASPLPAPPGVPAAGFEVAVEPPPEEGGSREDRIEVTSVVLYPAHDLRTGAPRGHFIQVGGRAILSRATCDALRPSLREVAMNVPRIPVLSFGAVVERQPLVRISERAIGQASLFADEPSLPSPVPGPLFYWTGSAQGREAALTVGLVRGELYRPSDGQPGAMPAFVCSADLRLPADVVARRAVVPVAEVGGTVAKTDDDGTLYEAVIRMPEALARSLSGLAPHGGDAGTLRIGPAGAVVRRDEAGTPGTLIAGTRQDRPRHPVEIAWRKAGVKIVFHAVQSVDR